MKGTTKWRTGLYGHSPKLIQADLFALDQQLIVSSAAPLTSFILVNRETLLQARLLSVTLYAVIFSLASVQVQSGGVAILRWLLACLQASLTMSAETLEIIKWSKEARSWTEICTCRACISILCHQRGWFLSGPFAILKIRLASSV